VAVCACNRVSPATITNKAISVIFLFNMILLFSTQNLFSIIL
jgi:hypothetical protein